MSKSAQVTSDDLKQILDALSDALIESTHDPDCATWKRGFEALPMASCDCWRREAYDTFTKFRHLRRSAREKK